MVQVTLKQRLSDSDGQIIKKQEKAVNLGCKLQQILFWGGLGSSSKPIHSPEQKVYPSIGGLF